MFVFKLQSILDYRINIEEKILDEFSKIRRELTAEELKLKYLMEERDNLTGELRKKSATPVPIENIAFPVSYIEKLRESEEKQNKIIDDIKEKLEARRTELLEAVKKRKIMEKIKERHCEEYEKSMREFEQKNSDEMAVLRFDRREK